MKIYFTFDPRPDLKEKVLKDFPDVEFIFHNSIDDGVLKEAEVLVTYGEDIEARHIEVAEKLQWIMVASAGIEKMPQKEIAKRGIVVSNVRGIHKIPMAESVLAHILAYKRGLVWIYEQEQKAEWSRKSKASELHGSTALLIGPGAIGSEIGRLLQAFGVHTIGCNRSGKSVDYMNDMISFDALQNTLPKVDVVISVLPSTPDTLHLLKYEHFKAMKDSALFMNFGRGDLVATDVLMNALIEAEIAHAVLDVYEEEPLPSDHPFWQMTTVTVSPHVSSHSSRYMERSLEIFKPNLRKWLVGDNELINKMDITKGY
ncbi:D-2-hydroxyacid dehydrogenase [Viridibacillus sp. YIM B01967]|uniref:D-2-hydroxyacid dehydrogenase n=1 Tax=Viridibacillus soli TaxID=2798301 RepID=A0ABS1H8T0_9BACL|nr:D-2-hydroxyacid dehydrogenase [Viridibacillus soli]MBK3495821.1 D-2-hydroxyacid dehydrogenase [Viridibacillus soli]